ncbi:MAG: hypothetical protein AB7G17_00385 [Phycisphaerales bacterium]
MGGSGWVGGMSRIDDTMSRIHDIEEMSRELDTGGVSGWIERLKKPKPIG